MKPKGCIGFAYIWIGIWMCLLCFQSQAQLLKEENTPLSSTSASMILLERSAEASLQPAQWTGYDIERSCKHCKRLIGTVAKRATRLKMNREEVIVTTQTICQQRGLSTHLNLQVLVLIF